MIYIFNILFSCMYLSLVKEKKLATFLVKISPIIILWVIIIGGQSDIGADYKNYLEFFINPHYETRYEPLFSWLSRFIYDLGFVGQGQFFIYALINAVIIFIASHKLGIKNWCIFYFLLITVSTFFNNQMNGIRQCTAVAFVYWAFVEFYSKKVRGIPLIAIATGFHYSAILCICFAYIKRITLFLTKYPKILLIASCLIALIPADDYINRTMIELLPDAVREETHYERAYSENEGLNETTGIIYKLSKLLLLPLYFYSLRLFIDDSLSDKEKFFVRFGILSYCLRCALLINNLIGRFTYYFWIPSILPIYYLASDYWKKQKYIKLLFLIIYSSAIYFIKVFMGTAEYKSSFIYFQ